jgi:hypothetical protein
MNYPNEVVRTMRGEMQNLKRVIGLHFKHRHDGRGNSLAKNWIAEYRRVNKASGYDTALKLISIK